jgi:predicted Zn-dependent protease
MPDLKRVLLVSLMAMTAGSAVPAARNETASPLGTILQSELRRNLDLLAKESVPPYFVSYTVHDVRGARVVASFGALQNSDQGRSRTGTVEVRAGNYTVDSTHPMRGGSSAAASLLGSLTSRVQLPFADVEAPIRAAFWRATDTAYRQATESLARVQANIVATVKEENPAPDFSREAPESSTAQPATATFDKALWERRARNISAQFAADPLIFRSDVQISSETTTRYYTNSEGTNLTTAGVVWRVGIQAATKADDGMELPLYATYFARTADGLPAEADLIREAREMVAQLARLRKAPLVDPATVPAILSGRAGGVFFHEIFGHRVEGHRQRSADDAQTFAKRLNEAVLPTFLSVVFDPTLERLGNVALSGYYQFDDEGVRARPVTVVEKGVLKTFLLGRTPLAAFPQSNGHGRAQPGSKPVSRQSSLLVQSQQTVSPERLLAMLREEIRKQGKPFGLYFENIEGGFTQTGRTTPNAFNVLPNVVYRVYADDRPRELVRGVDLIGTPLAAFSKIIATDNRMEVFNGMCGAESGSVPVSAASPALLISEVEVQKKSQSQDTLPILPAPPSRRGS